jgi:hypothetical protein
VEDFKQAVPEGERYYVSERKDKMLELEDPREEQDICILCGFWETYEKTSCGAPVSRVTVLPHETS